MTDLPRRTITELICLHELEGAVKDVFVEGDYDRAFVSRFLGDVGSADVAVRTIDCIEIDDARLRSQGRDVGNRERVILLAEQAEQCAMPAGKILCIADRDFDNWIGPPPVFRDLVLTDYSCMDAYAWNCAVVRRFLAVQCNRPSWDADQFMAVLRRPLLSMFAIRVAARTLGMHLEWLEQPRCVVLSGWEMDFDIREFVTRLLNKNSALSDFDLLWARVQGSRTETVEDARHAIHARDFSRLTAYVLAKKGVKRFAKDGTAVARAMAACVTVEELREEFLFQRLRTFAGGSA